MTPIRPSQLRAFSAFMALWLLLCAVATCATFSSQMSADAAAVLMGASGEPGGQDHCAPEGSAHRCDDRRASQHWNLVDLLPLFALLLLPFLPLARQPLLRLRKNIQAGFRPPLRLHLLHCVQLN